MNYIELHIGDFERDTAHLTACEDGIYGRLLRLYYKSEGPLADDVLALQRLVRARSRDEKAAVAAMLDEFFELTPMGWQQGRCDKEIARYQDKQAKAKRSAEARWNRTDGNANAMRTHSEGNALQTPDTNQKQKPKQEGRSAPLALPEWLPESDWKLWHDFRNGRKGWTGKARELSLRTLTTLRDDGYDPRAVIEQSIERGWTGLFPVRSAIAITSARRPQERTAGIAGILGVPHERHDESPRLVRAGDPERDCEPVPALPGRLAG